MGVRTAVSPSDTAPVAPADTAGDQGRRDSVFHWLDRPSLGGNVQVIR
jgi:hypothetical protein